MKLKFFTIIFLVAFVSGMSGLYFTDTFGQSENYEPSENDYVPYTQNYNVRFNSDGQIDYDSLIMTIMPEMFEKKLLTDYGVNVSQADIVFNRGPQISMYQESSSVCGYVVDYADNQVYWLRAGIDSTDIKNISISTDTPVPDMAGAPPGFEIEEFNLSWCFGPLKEKVATIFLEDKSYLTEKEEGIIVAAVKHELRGNPNLGKQEFSVGKFNFDYGENTLSFCGQFERDLSLKFFGGTLKNNILKDFHGESSLSPLCAIRDDAEIYPLQFVHENIDPSLVKWQNIRMETVYLKSESVEKLLERDYMHNQYIIYNMFDYSTAFDLNMIDFKPESSSTLFNFDPVDDDTFAKIRVPQYGGNYFMPYGPAEWNVGDITNVSISVGDDIVSYKTMPIVKSPEAPYPQHYTDYIFKVPKDSTTFTITLDIENYKPDTDHDSDHWNSYKPEN